MNMSHDNEYSKRYYQNHKEELATKIKCEICDGTYTRNAKLRHMRSRKHKDSVKCRELEEKLNKDKMSQPKKK